MDQMGLVGCIRTIGLQTRYALIFNHLITIFVLMLPSHFFVAAALASEVFITKC